MPAGYGVPDDLDGLIEWPAVEHRLIDATSYWLATTRPDGRPHVVPRWGVWVDGRFFYDGSPDTVHARNLERDPRCVLHLESGDQAVIVEGRSSRSPSPEPELAQRLSDAFGRKYAERGYRPTAEAWSGPDAGGLGVFTPLKVLAWFDFPHDVTRLRFGA